MIISLQIVLIKTSDVRSIFDSNNVNEFLSLVMGLGIIMEMVGILYLQSFSAHPKIIIINNST